MKEFAHFPAKSAIVKEIRTDQARELYIETRKVARANARAPPLMSLDGWMCRDVHFFVFPLFARSLTVGITDIVKVN